MIIFNWVTNRHSTRGNELKLQNLMILNDVLNTQISSSRYRSPWFVLSKHCIVEGQKYRIRESYIPVVLLLIMINLASIINTKKINFFCNSDHQFTLQKIRRGRGATEVIKILAEINRFEIILKVWKWKKEKLVSQFMPYCINSSIKSSASRIFSSVSLTNDILPTLFDWRDAIEKRQNKSFN